jgi:hypothetical protein
MPDFPLLGSLNNYAILSASGEKLLIDGPFFTCNELNLNGWGIPESEAAGFAATFTNQPVRWCPMGKTVLDPESGDVIAAEHYCDLINSQKTIVGKIVSVYPNGRNEKGNLVYWQKAEITDPSTVTGIVAGRIPSNVSMWAYGTELLGDGMVRGARGMSESIVTEPAYQEASFQYQIVAASLRRGSAKGAYVPKNPKDYGSSRGDWTAPTLKDFTSKGWDDLTESERNEIRSCFAAVTDDTFGGCKLPHHRSSGTVVKEGVDNAMARLGQTQGLGSIKSDVEAHLRSHQENDFKEGKGSSMPTEPEKKDLQVGLDGAPVKIDTVTPGVTINIGAGNVGAGKAAADGKEEEGGNDGHNAICASCGEKLPAGAGFCPACGASLHPRCASCFSSVPVGAKFCTSCGSTMTPTTGTTGDNTAQASKTPTLEVAVAAALAKAKDEDNRRALAASIAEVQIRTGVIAEADGPKTVEALFPLSASVLENQLSGIKIMASKIEASTEHGLQSGSLPGPMVKVGAGMLPKFAHGLPPENVIKAVFQRLGAQVEGKFVQMNWDHIFKYGSLKNVPGSGKWAGTYHQDREILPL